jgi:hypothetical protein
MLVEWFTRGETGNQTALDILDFALVAQAARAAAALCPRATRISPWNKAEAVNERRDDWLILTVWGLPQTVTVRSMTRTPFPSALRAGVSRRARQKIKGFGKDWIGSAGVAKRPFGR